MELSHGAIDVLRDAPYDQLRDRAPVIAFGDTRIPVAGRNDLIRTKLARGRPVDKADVAALADAEASNGVEDRAPMTSAGRPATSTPYSSRRAAG